MEITHMNRTKKTLHLNKIILLIVMIGYMAILCLLLLMDWYLIQNHHTEARRRELEVVENYVNRSEEALTDIDHEMYEIYTNNANFQILQNEQSEVLAFSNAYELRETLNYRSLVEEDIGGFFIYYNNREVSWYYTKADKIRSELGTQINQIIKDELKNAEQSRHWVSVILENNVYLAIIYEKKKAAVAGVYSMENVEELLKNNSCANTEVILMENDIVYKNRELAERLELSDLTGKYEDAFQVRRYNYQICGMRIPNTELWVFTAYPITLWSIINIWQLILLLVTAVSCGAVIIMYGFIKREVVYPIRQLTAAMGMIKNGENREIPSLGSRFQELQEVNDTLNEMVRELKQQKLLVYEEIIEKQKAQMQYLQLQLKPHFYLNGLKTLNALAVEKQTDKIQELIMNLSKHLRYLLQTEQETVYLHLELDFVQNYIELQKHITGRPVFCTVTADDKAKNWKVPTLAVQTFVENSVKYARLGGGSIPLEIQVTAECLETEEGVWLDLLIRDNGQGYPEEILKEINNDPKAGIRSVGINNIKRRCQFLYGGRIEYRFENEDGAVSELILPEGQNERIVSR